MVAIFVLGLACRLPPLFRVHQEGDELIYRALVENLDAGRGYTLLGHPILRQPWLVRETYGRPLFFHPPGGIGLFWLSHRLFGGAGFQIAELLSFTVFFWSMLYLATTIAGRTSKLQAALTAGLAAFTPIMTHVISRFWLDGPLLAFSSLAAAIFLSPRGRGRTDQACVAGAVLGYACLIKPTALLIVPGMLALFWATMPPGSGRSSWKSVLAPALPLIVVAVCLLAPWEIYQWSQIGNPMAVAPGKPSAHLLSIDRYVRYVTVGRSPWVYLQLLPIVVWSLGPGLVLSAWQGNDPWLRRRALALLAWTVPVLATLIILGYWGYSKLLRYVILVTPATVLLFPLAFDTAWKSMRGRAGSPGRRNALLVILVLGLTSFGLEVAQGIKTPLVDNFDLIRSLVQ